MISLLVFRTNPLYVGDQHSPVVSIETEIAAEQDNEGRKTSSSTSKFASRSAGSAHSSSSGYSSTSHSQSQRQDQEGEEDHHTGWLFLSPKNIMLGA